MKKAILEVGRMLLCVAIVPALSLSLLSCDSEDGVGGGGTSSIVPEVSVPDGYVNYFIEDLYFTRSEAEEILAFQINVDWSLKVVSENGESVSWCSVEPSIGGAGLHKVAVYVTENKSDKPRTAKIQLMSGKSKVAEILVVQEEALQYEAIDLGLSVKWASFNVGAEYPEEYGAYYAWGEIEECILTNWRNYKWCSTYSDGSANSFTKYSASGSLELEDDVAHILWGDGWRMPTMEEIEELINECTWRWTEVNGVAGYNVVGSNGNSIFLPAAGERDGTEVEEKGSKGYFWSATRRIGSDVTHAQCIYFTNGGVIWNLGNYRYCGCTVRPVTE